MFKSRLRLLGFFYWVFKVILECFVTSLDCYVEELINIFCVRFLFDSNGSCCVSAGLMLDISWIPPWFCLRHFWWLYFLVWVSCLVYNYCGFQNPPIVDLERYLFCWRFYELFSYLCLSVGFLRILPRLRSVSVFSGCEISVSTQTPSFYTGLKACLNFINICYFKFFSLYLVDSFEVEFCCCNNSVSTSPSLFREVFP